VNSPLLPDQVAELVGGVIVREANEEKETNVLDGKMKALVPFDFALSIVVASAVVNPSFAAINLASER
jgi:hypothetical protein